MVLACMRASAIHGPPLSVESREFSQLAGGSRGTTGMLTVRLMSGGCGDRFAGCGGCSAAGGSRGTTGMVTVRLMSGGHGNRFAGCGGCSAGCGDWFAGRLRPASRGDVRVPEEVAASPPVLPFDGTGGFAVGAARRLCNRHGNWLCGRHGNWLCGRRGNRLFGRCGNRLCGRCGIAC